MSTSKSKKRRKYAAVKRLISANDTRLHLREQEHETNEKNRSKTLAPPRSVVIREARRKEIERLRTLKRKSNPDVSDDDEELIAQAEKKVVHAAPIQSGMFFTHNTQLGPPYHVLVDTNFINFSIQHKLELFESMMDCLYAKCTAYITDCVVGELEKLGPRFRIAMRIARDPRFVRLKCAHKGVYADDCIVDRVTMSRCYIVATCDRDLRRRLRKIPGVPIMYIAQERYTVERMINAFGAPR